MSRVDEIFQSYVNKSYNELFSSAEGSYSRLYKAFAEAFGDSKKAVQTLLTLVFTSVCADGQLSDLETRFLNDLADTNYSRSEMAKIVSGHGRASAYAEADRIFDSMPDLAQEELLNLCLCVCAVDERITKEEVAFIMQLVD